MSAERTRDPEEPASDAMPDIGDGPCGRCGGNNPVVWFASPNERWNEVYGNGSGLRCPNCFFADAAAAGFDRMWAFIPEDEKELAWRDRWEHGRRVGLEEGEAEIQRLTGELERAKVKNADSNAMMQEAML